MAGSSGRKHQVDYQYPLHRPRRQRRPPAGGLPLLPRRAGGPVYPVHPHHRAGYEDLLPLANPGLERDERGGERPLYIQEGHLVTERSVKAEQFGRFLIEIFEEWVRRDVGVSTCSISMCPGQLGWAAQPGICVFAPTCGNALALEHNGDLYSCDHYVEPDYLLGNIKDSHMIELVASDQQAQFGQDKMTTLPRYCRECEVRFRLPRRLSQEPLYRDPRR